MLSEIETAELRRHRVQFYGANSAPLVRNVGAYLARGLADSGGAIVIAGPAHRAALDERLGACGIDSAAALDAGRLTVLDAADTLDRFMVGDEPHHGRFDQTVGAAVRTLHGADGGRVRAFGEMVGILWQRGNRAGAVALECLWTGLLAARGFSIYCAYPVDVLASGFRQEALDDVLAAHTHVIDTGVPGALGNAVLRALDEVLGMRADGLRQLMRAKNFRPAWAELPEGEATVLWLRRNLPDEADEVLARARHYFN